MTSLRSIRCVKWLVFIFNLLFFLTGCCLIGFGVWLNVARNDWQGISDYGYISIANVAIVTGCIIVLMAFLGCCGAITENKIMLLVFFIFLLLVFLLEIGAGVSAYVWRNKIDNELLNQLEKRIPERYYQETAVETAVNKIQEYFECCGLYNSNDWSKQSSEGTPSIDQSCCIQDSAHAQYSANCITRPWSMIEGNPGLQKEYYETGCYTSIKDFIKENMWLTAVFGCTFAGLQLCGMILSMCLYCVLRRQDAVY